MFAKGARRVNWAFLTGVTSILHGTVGIAGNILNTLIIILLTMIITTPIGVGAAIYLNEYAKPGKLVTVIIFATETLAEFHQLYLVCLVCFSSDSYVTWDIHF